MITAFQRNAFQDNAFQIGITVPISKIELPPGQYQKPKKARRAPFVTVEGQALIDALRRDSSMEEHRPLEPVVTGSKPVPASIFTLADQLVIKSRDLGSIELLKNSITIARTPVDVLSIGDSVRKRKQEENLLIALFLLSEDIIN